MRGKKRKMGTEDPTIIGHQSKDWFVADLQSSLFSTSLFIP
jgi:hypothetical protein